MGTFSSSYSGNLPNPNAVCGNPCIDTSVPWSTLTVSTTVDAASAANIAYAKVSMYGIDGSYWAGDYGPWYRAPTFTRNGGGNLTYNPEFGPYNNVTAQGWTANPGFGACQGAWGGSNACIVNSDGVPGSSTVGLVANVNGGGPSLLGGTTSGTAGGYNNTMTTTNAGTGATAGSPPAPTVVSTSSSTSTTLLIIGNLQKQTSIVATTTTYSDGTTQTTNSAPTTTTLSSSAFTGVHFGKAQVADTQWNVQACTQTNSCQIYSTQPGVTWNTGSPTTIGNNQYITFIPNTGSNAATNPWIMILVNSDGTFTSLGPCRITVQGADGAGNIFLFVANDNYNGTLLSGNLGLSGQGTTFTGTLNPTADQTNTLSTNMSPDPLAAGQSYSTLCCGGSSAPFNANTSFNARVQTFLNRTTADSQVYIEQIGNSNTITVQQTGTKNNYVDYFGNGSFNTVTINQSGNSSTAVNYIEANIGTAQSASNSNTVNLTQTSTGGGKGMMVNVTGSNNNLTIQQKDSGSHYAEVQLSGGNKTVDITQSGTAGHMANINLSGNPTNLTLTQTGVTQQFYSITHSCATSGGCAAITVTQGQ